MTEIYRFGKTSRMIVVLTSLSVVALSFAGCRGHQMRVEDPLFVALPTDRTQITFSNDLGYAYEFNIYRYRNFYNGGGVALGDVNNDGLLDIYFTGNQVDNRLYLNEGGFRFRDVTEAAGVAGARAWSTGVSMADVNGDGWLDIYVCNAGIVDGDDKKNELYVNQGDGTFSEMAESYGLADAGLSVHGVFLDYDRDGDLDLYQVNNSYRNIGSFDLRENTRHIRHQAGGDRLYRNPLISAGKTLSPGDIPYFEDVSEQAGIYGSEIGFGLGASVGDVNRDGWPDVYISNDFFERDYLYLNNQDGTFDEVLEKGILSVSAAAMGADMADLNGDGYPEIFVTDMLPKPNARVKTVTSFDSWERYQNYISDDYYHQFTRNTLHMNRGAGADDRPGLRIVPAHFSEVGRMAGVEASDWSWGALIADFDLDGYRDLFVANGIYQDLTNADYLVEIRDESTMDRLIGENYVDFETLIAMIPSVPISNYMFAGKEGVKFSDETDSWGLAEPGFSNGSAYGDLDNDGDLDLVINNVNMEAFVYRNEAVDRYPERRWLQVELQGPYANTRAVGAQVTAWAGGRQWYLEQQPIRGFQSTVDPVLHFGFGEHLANGRLDSLVIQWPDGSLRAITGVEVNQRLSVTHSVGERRDVSPRLDRSFQTSSSPSLEPVDPATLGLDWRHTENEFSDFDRQPLLFHMRSTEGPAVCVGDPNGDGRQDIYLGGAKDRPGALFMQIDGGLFERSSQPVLQNDTIAEDTDCLWFDADGDGDEDLYVASGGSEYSSSSSALRDRLYFNDGSARLNRSDQLLIAATAGFEPTGAVAAADFDADGDQDLFVGARMLPFAVGMPADGHLLVNDGAGRFSEATDERAPELRNLGMITDARWVDVDGDSDLDLSVAGEWMPLSIFENRDGTLVKKSNAGFEATSGWWNALAWADLDSDGDQDFIGANHGLNSRFRASPDAPVEVWVDDFDRNGSVEQVIGIYENGQVYPLLLRHDLIDQIPSLERAFPTYASYAGKTIQDIFPEELLNGAVHHSVVELRSVVGWNDGEGHFRVQPLPDEAQLAPMYGIWIADINEDGRKEILMGGNLYEAKPEQGRYDASYGAALAVDGEKIAPLGFSESGFWVTGPIRKIVELELAGRRLLLVARNNDSLKVYGL